MDNTWTEAENFLLVEKLTSKSEEESWKEVAEMVDNSGTFKTESFKCKAVRKYAAHHGVAYESVTVEEVANSPQGLRGWAELTITVPGVVDAPEDQEGPGQEAGAAVQPPGQKVPKPKASQSGNNRRRSAEAGASEGKEPKKRVKKEPTQEQQAEKNAKDILCQLAWSAQIMEKAAGDGNDLPSEWKWAKSFLEEYAEVMRRFKEGLAPADGGDNITEFVDELKLHVISKTGLRDLKKTIGADLYQQKLLLFVDRCKAVSAQNLAFDFTWLFLKQVGGLGGHLHFLKLCYGALFNPVWINPRPHQG